MHYEMPKQTVNNVVAFLEKKGVIVASQNPNDKREKYLDFTESGKKYAEDFLTPYWDFEKRVYQKLGTQKLQRLTELLKDFEAAFAAELLKMEKK